jgi:amidase
MKRKEDSRKSGAEGIDRRSFFRYGALGGAAAMAGGALGAPARAVRNSPSEVAKPGPFELDERTVTDLQKKMASGEETARSLAEKYLFRIDEVDRKGPELRSVIETNPDALEIAAELDGERKAGRLRGPLHGIPVLVKDNVGTADRMTTTAGSLALEGSVPHRDSFVAARLREAGAVILGKANLSEWANFRSTHSTSGWSGRGGQCRNPYALDRNPSGSSSGSAVAVAANLCAVAVGTETDGSIVSPSNNCGLVGIKPTLGLVSRSGIVPIAHSQDTAGPIGRTVADAAALLSALTGVDPADGATARSAGRISKDYTKFLDKNALAGARIGVPRRGLFGQCPAADRLAEEAIGVMKSLGAVIIDPADVPSIGRFGQSNSWGGSELQVLLYEFKADLNAYLVSLGAGAPVHSLAEIIAFNEKNRDREMPFFGQELFLQAQEKGPLTEKKYRGALARDHRLSRSQGIDAVMNKHRLDALIAPTSGPAVLTDLVNGDYGPGGSTTLPAVAGYPDITVPMGFDFGLPVGLSFFGRAWSEPKLIAIAYAYEQATMHRAPPGFLPTADLTVRG